MSELDNPRLKYTRKIIDQFLVVNFIQSLLMVIFYELLDSPFQALWNPFSPRKL